MPTIADVHHLSNPPRFELLVGDQRCEATYLLDGAVMRVVHTGVPPALQGQGLAALVVQAALDHARQQGWRVDPQCSYVRAYMRRHPETQDLLAS